VYAVNSAGDCLAKDPEGGVTALTWGVFPNKEILQPTIFDFNTFVVWSKESFQLWIDAWASLYDDDSESADLLYMVRFFSRPPPQVVY
jgi:methylenetetrahydrofolate reductase (NADPH)